MLDVDLGQETSLGDEAALREGEGIHDAPHTRRAHLIVAMMQVVLGVVPEIPLRRHGPSLRDRSADRGGVVEGQLAPPRLAFGLRTSRSEAGLVLLEHDHGRPEALEAADHVVVEAGHDRDHRDDRRDADNDAEDGQTGAQLVGAHREQGEPHVLAEAATQMGEDAGHGFSFS
jgi:hypothetical protein